MKSIDTAPTSSSRGRRAIELLAPARNLQCGIAAIDHGADAVYIGGPGYGARSAAGNSVEDIGALCQYAHRYAARVYVTINTIVYDGELEAVRRLAWQLHDVGTDAFIVQDMALAAMDGMPPTPLHASTQMDNRSPGKIAWLHSQGFAQAVLARELTLKDISRIHQAVPAMPLEAFIHGAVCVSLSGRCYASQYLMGRSANRGECAQVCRLPFDLIDGEGNVLARSRHLLSLCDMNRTASLEAMMDAGVSSFKIEGRLKDVDYVKNVTAHYRRALDAILKRRGDEYCRASLGTCTFTFTPDPEKSFNRGFTDYFLNGRPAEASPLTPKMMGPAVARVTAVRRDHIVVRALQAVSSGDGLCFIDGDGGLQGFRVNRADGERLYLRPMPRHLAVGTVLRRNHDQAFEAALQGTTADRRIDVVITYEKGKDGFILRCGDTAVESQYPHEPSRSPQDENIARQLSRLGDTPYRATVVVKSGGDCFVPSSLLSQWRRRLVEALDQALVPSRPDETAARPCCPAPDEPHANVANRVASRYLGTPVNAFELHPDPSQPLMTCRHCVRRLMGMCGKAVKLPWHLVMSDGRRLRLDFDCQHCTMHVHADS